MTVCYFTATGNCLYVARRLGGKLLSIPQLMRQDEIVIADDAVGVVLPVYAVEMPMMVKNFLEKARIQTEYFFFIYTYVYVTAKKAGLTLSYINAIQMVDNYLPFFDMKEQIETLPEKNVEGQIEQIVSPLGYPAKERSVVDQKLRNTIHGDERLPAAELFFDGDFSTPLKPEDELLELVRWAPSAANMQPCRVVKSGNKYHFYEKHTEGYTGSAPWDVQKVDMGIALCHFMSAAKGDFEIANPRIVVSEDMEYIATVII